MVAIKKHLITLGLKSASIALLLNITSVTIAEESVTWTGCGITKKAFMSEIAKAYEKKTGIEIKLSGGGAIKGIRATAAGSSDLGGTCRHWLIQEGSIHPEENQADLTIVAWDAIVAITHPDNPITNISLADLKKIYDGDITSWKDLGGDDKKIILVTRSGKYSGVGYMFKHLAFDDPEYDFKARSLTMKSSGPLEKKVEKSVAAFGVTGISSAKKRKVKILSLDGIEPTKENIASGAYPLWRPLYIAKNKQASEEATKVVDFILSEEGQAIVSAQGSVNLKEGEALKPLWDAKKEKMGLK